MIMAVRRISNGEVNSVMGSHCDYLPRAPKHLAMPLMVTTGKTAVGDSV